MEDCKIPFEDLPLLHDGVEWMSFRNDLIGLRETMTILSNDYYPSLEMYELADGESDSEERTTNVNQYGRKYINFVLGSDKYRDGLLILNKCSVNQAVILDSIKGKNDREGLWEGLYYDLNKGNLDGVVLRNKRKR